MSLHTLPAERCPVPGDLGGCSCNRNNASHRLGGFQPSLSHIALMQPDIYIPLYPAPLTLRLISKPHSAQPFSWAHNATCQHHLPGTAARLGTWQRCRTQSSSILIPPCAPASNTPGDPVTEAQPATKSSHNRVTPVNARPLYQRRLGQLATVTKNCDGSGRCQGLKRLSQPPNPCCLPLSQVVSQPRDLCRGHLAVPRQGRCNPHCAGSPTQTEPAKISPHRQS